MLLTFKDRKYLGFGLYRRKAYAEARFVSFEFVVGFGNYQLQLCWLQLEQLRQLLGVSHNSDSQMCAAHRPPNDSFSRSHVIGAAPKVDIKILFSRAYVIEATRHELHQWHSLISDALIVLLPYADTLLYDFGVQPNSACRDRRAEPANVRLSRGGSWSDVQNKLDHIPHTYCQRCTARFAWMRKMIELMNRQMAKAMNSSVSECRSARGDVQSDIKCAWPLRVLCSASFDFRKWFANFGVSKV